MKAVAEKPSYLTTSPIHSNSKNYPMYYRSGGAFIKVLSPGIFKKYFVSKYTRRGIECFEYWSSKEVVEPAQLDAWLKHGGYHPCHEAEYEEIRKKYLEAHGLKTN